ncbi:PIN2/TERF1-interacting telomerase inhibitor 1 [Geodia barretti]|uniref:PIN2/TERF1-interacting telomerase inhibitor 1 n=1 Tax=Geodia barretti TaxID=519541 RepID=A0AA35SVK5_GEOBA|nr:PIN2/TERF1-interacting telomerase inhibitor 1 [Geodia barretti]
MDENFLETVSTVERYGNVAITACSSPFCSHCLHALSPDSVLCTHKHTSDASTTHAHAHAHCTKARPLAETPACCSGRPGWLAMLAEKKYKQKWSEDPRNSRWSEDRSRFGYRMLERMGWSEGKGLGKDLAGKTEHVKVSKRSDTSGVGYVRGRDEEWIEHQESFDQLLASLNAKKDNDVGSENQGAKSLVTSAINSGRALYKKALRSKDLSSASSKDLDCVFGRRGRKERRERKRERGERGGGEEEEEEGEEEEKKERTKRTKTEGTSENEQLTKESLPVISHGVATITQTATVQEYFATKLTNYTADSGCGLEDVGRHGLGAGGCGQEGET